MVVRKTRHPKQNKHIKKKQTTNKMTKKQPTNIQQYQTNHKQNDKKQLTNEPKPRKFLFKSEALNKKADTKTYCLLAKL